MRSAERIEEIPIGCRRAEDWWVWLWRWSTWNTSFDKESSTTRSIYDPIGPDELPPIGRMWVSPKKRGLISHRAGIRRINAGIFDFELVRRVAVEDEATKRWVRLLPPWPPYHKADPFTRDLLQPFKASNRPVSYRVLELLDRFDIGNEEAFNDSERSNMAKARARALELFPVFKERARKALLEEEQSMGIAEDDAF